MQGGSPSREESTPRAPGRGSPPPLRAPLPAAPSPVPGGAAAGTSAARNRRLCPARNRRGSSRGRRAPFAPGKGCPGGRAYRPPPPLAPAPAAGAGGSPTPPRRLRLPPPSWLWAVPGRGQVPPRRAGAAGGGGGCAKRQRGLRAPPAEAMGSLA